MDFVTLMWLNEGMEAYETTKQRYENLARISRNEAARGYRNARQAERLSGHEIAVELRGLARKQSRAARNWQRLADNTPEGTYS